MGCSQSADIQPPVQPLSPLVKQESAPIPQKKAASVKSVKSNKSNAMANYALGNPKRKQETLSKKSKSIASMNKSDDVGATSRRSFMNLKVNSKVIQTRQAKSQKGNRSHVSNLRNLKLDVSKVIEQNEEDVILMPKVKKVETIDSIIDKYRNQMRRSQSQFNTSHYNKSMGKTATQSWVKFKEQDPYVTSTIVEHMKREEQNKQRSKKKSKAQLDPRLSELIRIYAL